MREALVDLGKFLKSGTQKSETHSNSCESVSSFPKMDTRLKSKFSTQQTGGDSFGVLRFRPDQSDSNHD